MRPYVLLECKKVPLESAPAPEHVYDNDRQIWVDKNSGEPLVSLMQARATQFGETTLTATREGADQPEGMAHASEFGETLETRTREGMDQTEGNVLLEVSQFGESTVTKTREGADQPEGPTVQEFDAAYSHF